MRREAQESLAASVAAGGEMGATNMLDQITPGEVYVYTNAIPAGCAGHHYRAHRFVLDVPSYQQKVLVEALSGKDKGLWFVCSVANFRVRYVPLVDVVAGNGVHEAREHGG